MDTKNLEIKSKNIQRFVNVKGKVLEKITSNQVYLMIFSGFEIL